MMVYYGGERFWCGGRNEVHESKPRILAYLQFSTMYLVAENWYMCIWMRSVWYI